MNSNCSPPSLMAQQPCNEATSATKESKDSRRPPIPVTGGAATATTWPRAGPPPPVHQVTTASWTSRAPCPRRTPRPSLARGGATALGAPTAVQSPPGTKEAVASRFTDLLRWTRLRRTVTLDKRKASPAEACHSLRDSLARLNLGVPTWAWVWQVACNRTLSWVFIPTHRGRFREL